ncbi:Pentatricopeptide repeat-containing protein [Quillaja saponaria]|uniref:Pentatricopeptide repeat-containing protein n=1 Tax=Quillaja saponaria TaxID=32244 RepID=A0AAD7LCR0_QUISA|nr:Pentatricopeptide repeat-containing protein [Quillaja saponaria]KAJ7955479.1 Pentatricopeptide repeat-containing protein [Quillaja saponaria]
MNDLLDLDLSRPSHPSPQTILHPPPNSDPRIVHAQAIVGGQTDRFTFNNLITLYSKSSLLSYSLRLFHQIPSPNVVSWTSIISAHANTFLSLQDFIFMLRHPTLPNQRTLATLFRTCAALPCLTFGVSLHCVAVKLSLCDGPFTGSALINFYSKCRLPNEARKVFDEIPLKDEVCYAAAIVGLAQNSRSIDALSIFANMKSCDVASTMYSVSGALRAAAELAALEQCKIIHAHTVVTGFDSNVVVGSGMVDGYGKAGLVLDARLFFDENLPVMNMVGWNAMMAGYAQQGDTKSTLELFYSMEARGLVPDQYSFLAILTSLSNGGLFLETEQWLTRMKVTYGVEPWLEHYTCLVGALGRAGRLEAAQRIAMTMPFEPDAAVWRALLSSCAYHGAADMAWSMARQLLELDPHDDSAYIIVANVLSATGRWDEVAEVRKMMKDRGVKKEGGRSWIEVRGKVHVFLAGDRRHNRSEEIYLKLAELMEEIEKLGYVPVSYEMLHEVGEREKKEALWYHSEKLALAFGVVSGAVPPGKAIRIVKNLRICKDCHHAFKYMSRVLEREIIVRDVNRYHRFLNGSCTCGDIW